MSRLVMYCGVLFTTDHQLGVDLILPDLTFLRDLLDNIEAIFLTHGHEDHIGVVPYLLRERRDIPVIGSELPIALVTAKLKEHGIKPRTRVVKEGEDRKSVV